MADDFDVEAMLEAPYKKVSGRPEVGGFFFLRPLRISSTKINYIIIYLLLCFFNPYGYHSNDEHKGRNF